MTEIILSGAAIGAIVTVIVQSSPATVAMVLTLAKESLITLPAGIAVMLGAELGTCADTLLATVRSTRQALKTGLFHLIFNLIPHKRRDWTDFCKRNSRIVRHRSRGCGKISIRLFPERLIST